MPAATCVENGFWRGKRVFITGHTGFKGSWLSLYLQLLGADVKGYALNPAEENSLFQVADVEAEMVSEIGDILDGEQLSISMRQFEPDVLIHMAAQPLVRLSYKEPALTYATNVMGTVNVLEAARNCRKLKAIVNVTTDKCYENREWPWPYRETEAMGGHDPYSSSKGCAELVNAAYQRSFFNTEDSAWLASVRAGNVIGGGDAAEDRLIPDILRSFKANEALIVRYPDAIRPWQHVLEPLTGYLVLAQALYEKGSDFAEGWNFGPNAESVKPVRWIVDFMAEKWGAGASWKNNGDEQLHEAGLLKLDISKATSRLDWKPKLTLEESLNRIVEWEKAFEHGQNMKNATQEQIEKYWSHA
jgi:CDP-glucose 4,6-dehydratase